MTLEDFKSIPDFTKSKLLNLSTKSMSNTMLLISNSLSSLGKITQFILKPSKLSAISPISTITLAICKR